MTTPAISPAAGTYTDSVTVSISTTTIGASIYYTLTESPPTTSSMPYNGAFALTDSATVKAIGILDGSSSAVSSHTYTVVPMDRKSNAMSRLSELRPTRIRHNDRACWGPSC